MNHTSAAAAPETGKHEPTERSDAEAKLAGAARRDGEQRPTGREANPIDVTSDSLRVAEPPTFEELAADPEIAPLLNFAPVPRSHAKANGWTADMQRMFIAWLAWYGSATNACAELGKARSGIDKVYRSEGADEFRASWEAAIALAERRRIAALSSRRGGAGALRAPALSRGLPPPEAAADEDEENEEAKEELMRGLAVKFLRKVAAERTARLNGEIVAADFYLRQVTVLEVLFDLGATSAGFSPADFLFALRRDGVEMRSIVSTAFTDHLDAQRRRWWAEEGQPERPLHPDPRFVEHHHSAHGDFGVEVEDNAYGAASTPARGYSQEEWAAMGIDAQEAARQRQQAEDAAEQRAWEARAHQDFENRRDSAR